MGANLDLHAAPPTLDDIVAPAAACFAAPTPCGPLRLYVTTHELRHAVDAALALHRCETLLRALETWSGLALDWRWDESPTIPDAGTHLSVTLAEGEIDLPWAWLRELPPPDAALAALLPWPQVPAVLAISQLRIGIEELAQLEPGGAVLLADSLRPGWQGLLRAADEPAHGGVPVTLPLPDAPRFAPRGVLHAAHADADRRMACGVRLPIAGTLRADRLAGWHAGEPLPDPGPRATLWRHAGTHGAAHALAAGSLMPWGDGCALHIETVYRQWT
jgi:hypothetical protein